jgi:hypothetical protein
VDIKHLRKGAMACCVLPQVQEAEDLFQATFLALASKAASSR